MIDKATIQKIMDATNIYDVVSEYVSLRKSGASYKGLCPFHDDKTPSFYVNPVRGICKCFSCGKGGNAVNFLMEHNQMTYVEALHWLAKKYNIEIKERMLTDEEQQKEHERESMFIINDWVNNYFQDLLHNDPDGVAVGMQYFRQRGFRDDIIKKFQLGFDLPDRHKLAGAAVEKGYKKEFLAKTGVCYVNDQGQYIDRFAGRVTFPWIDRSGRVVGFTARVLDSRTKGVNQKYVNSPDSEIYHKGNELYGIYQAKKAINKHDHVYLVEGQADVISMHQAGIENVVAGSGTALTPYQVKMLHRFTSNITLIYDDDEAGHKAALKGTNEILSEGMNLKILLLPGGMDPDDFCRSRSTDEIKKYIEDHSTDFIQFKSDLLLKGVANDPVKRSEAINSVVQSVAVITDQITRATYIHECAQRFGIAENTLISEMNRMIRNGKDEQRKEEERHQRQQQGNAAAGWAQQQAMSSTAIQYGIDPKVAKVEEELIRIVMKYGEQPIVVNDVEGNEVTLPVAQYVALDLGGDSLQFKTPLYNTILSEAVQHLGDEGFKAETYFMQHHQVEISQLALNLCVDHYQLSDSLKVTMTMEKLRDTTLRLVLGFRMNYIEARLQQLKMEISQAASDVDEMMQKMSEYKQMVEIRNCIANKLGNDLVI